MSTIRTFVCINCEASLNLVGSPEDWRTQLAQLRWRLGCGTSAGIIADGDENGYCCQRCSSETGNARAERLATDVLKDLALTVSHNVFRDQRGTFLQLQVEPEPLVISFDLGRRDAAVRSSLKEALSIGLSFRGGALMSAGSR
jgi:hypothetical protein